MGPAEGDEPSGAPTEPEATSRRTSTELHETATAGTTEGHPDDADNLSAAGDAAEASQEKESAKYIEKRGYAIFTVTEVCNLMINIERIVNHSQSVRAILTTSRNVLAHFSVRYAFRIVYFLVCWSKTVRAICAVVFF